MDHQAAYEQLSDGNNVDGLEDLPIDQIRARIAQSFTQSWQQIDKNTWEGETGAFQLFTTHQFFRVTCYGLSRDAMNSIIDVLVEFRCPLYDPQVGERFDSF